MPFTNFNSPRVFFCLFGFVLLVFLCGFFFFNIPLVLLCCASKHRNQTQDKSLEGEGWMAGNKNLTYLLLCIPLNTSLTRFPWEDNILVMGQNIPVLFLRFWSKGLSKQWKSLSAGHLGCLLLIYNGINDWCILIRSCSLLNIRTWETGRCSC